MASNVEIVNRALTKLGESRILALTDDTKAARDANSLFAIVRDAELRASRWRFAIKRVVLPALSTAPAFGYDRQFQLPTDCLKALDVGDFYPGVDTSDYIASDTAEYAIEGNAILTNLAAPLRLRYIARIEDPTLFDASFVEALACKLAIELCESLTDSGSKRQQSWQEYEIAINAAHRANAIERAPTKIADDTWILTRK